MSSESYRFPRAVHADLATLSEQQTAVINEAHELWWLMDEPIRFTNGRPTLPADTPERFIEEAFDVMHAAETLVRMIQEKHPHVDLEVQRAKVIEKNRKRGYYGEETP